MKQSFRYSLHFSDCLCFFKVFFRNAQLFSVLLLFFALTSQSVVGQIISWDFNSGKTPNINLPGGTTSLSFNIGLNAGTLACLGNGYFSNGYNIEEDLKNFILLPIYELTTTNFKVQSSSTALMWGFHFVNILSFKHKCATCSNS
jgi:hypothetical protein